ncbi:MAG: AAA family ATPase, partial [Actinomycetota bacterium]|nr:AAA family ATPase [Actinomycetota bacterium]
MAPHLDPWIAELALDGRRSRGRRRGRANNKPSAKDDPVAASLTAVIESPRRLAVIGLKGGTGKTTLAVAMAMTYARVRREHILLFDADTRHGSL